MMTITYPGVMTEIPTVTHEAHRARGFRKPRGVAILDGVTLRIPPYGTSVRLTAQFDSPQEAAAFAAHFPKAALIKHPAGHDSIHSFVNLKPTGVTGESNETGLKRLHQWLATIAEHGLPVEVLVANWADDTHGWTGEDFLHYHATGELPKEAP